MRSPSPSTAGEQLLDPVACLAVVRLSKSAATPGGSSGVAHPPQQAAGFAGPPIDSGRDVEHHRQFVRRRGRQRCGDHHLVARAARRDPGAGRRADGGQLRSAGQHDPFGVDGPVRGVDADDPAAGRAQPGEAVRSRTYAGVVSAAV